MSDKPLHVRVAEALGCKPGSDPQRPWKDEWKCPCAGEQHTEHGLHPPCCDDWEDERLIARYDLDWDATGPLIQRFGISLVVPDDYNPEKSAGAYIAGTGGAHGWDDGSVIMADEAAGETPLVAVCNLILALASAGKLPE